MDNNTALEASSSSSPSSSSERWKYDVFLSFRGEDTRQNFTDCLYWRLIFNKVKVYIDQKSLTRGEIISEELEKAIEQSRIFVIVFSRRYANSRWCLDELEKIMECRRRGLGQMVLPIFYDVKPTDVRNQTGSFAEAFDEHKVRFNGDGNKVQRWKSACNEAANLAGHDFGITDRYEGKFIQGIVDDINRKLKNTYLHEATNQIGIKSRVQQLSNYLHVDRLDDVRIIGISGMAGTGKTTVAKAIFNKFHEKFEAASFLSEVSGGNMVELQNQLLCDILKTANEEVRTVAEGTKEITKRLSSIRVLVIIDDVGCEEKLRELAINRDSFGPGSRIIITTTNAHCLRKLEVDGVYSIPEMSNEEALKLFCCHAFTAVHPEDDTYLKLARKVVKYCAGLPLALEVLGSFLCKKDKKQWKSALDKWKKMGPHGPIRNKLKISYEGLPDNQVKDIFLDISCFFIGMNKDYVMSLLDGCEFYIETGIGELHDRCLVSVDKRNNLIMHDLLRDIGREIVREKSPYKKEERCRLWDGEDAEEVLRSNSGTEKIEGLTLELQESHQHCFSAEVFERMRGLRFLKLKGVKFTGHCKHLSKKLSWLCWPEFPLKALPEDFNQSNIVDIDLSHSHIQVWKDSDVSKKLKFLNLGYCKSLKESPDFSKLPELEKLILQGCKNLSKINSSIVDLKNLKYLYLAECNLPNNAIPEDLGALSSLEVLDLRGNDFNKLPTLSSLSKLQTLQLDNCSNLMVIPDLPTKLEILQADECIALEKMPKFSELLCIRELYLNHSPKLTEIPGLDKSLQSMTRIHMEGCTNLTADFKAILQGWSASRNGCLFLPTDDFPSSPRHVDPKCEILCCIPKFWV